MNSKDLNTVFKNIERFMREYHNDNYVNNLPDNLKNNLIVDFVLEEKSMYSLTILIVFKLKIINTFNLGDISFYADNTDEFHFSTQFNINFIYDNKETKYNILEYIANDKKVQEKYREFSSKYFETIKEIGEKEFVKSLLSLNNYAEDSTFNNKLDTMLSLTIDNDEDVNVQIITSYKNIESNPLTLTGFLTKFETGKPIIIKKLKINNAKLAYFTEKSKDLVQDLLQISQVTKRNYGSKRTIEESFVEVGYLNNYFKNNINNTIKINDNYYLIQLKDLNEKITINDDYSLDIKNKDNYIPIPHTDYVINKKEKTIDCISKNQVFLDLYNLVNSSSYPSIKNIKDEFKFNYFLPLMDCFNYSNKIKREFNINSLTIDAYFDFDSQFNITLKSKYFISEVETTPSNLKGDSLAVYNQYLRILEDLGFEDNILKDQDAILNFLTSDLSRLKALANIYLSQEILNKQVIKFTPPTIRIQNRSNLLNAIYEDSEYSNEELYQILNAIKKKKKFILLKNNIINLNDENNSNFSKIAEDLTLFDKNLTKKGKDLPLYFAFKIKNNEFVDSKDDYIDNLYNDFKNYKSLELKPIEVNATLRPYQLDGLRWLNTLYKYGVGGILADDMGLGKTLEVIAFLSSQNINAPILIVSPTSLIFNWISEFKRFNLKEKIIPIYGGAQLRKDRARSIRLNERCIYITSYDSLRNDIDSYQEIKFDTVILDEAQFIKNMAALKSQSVKKLNAIHKFVLTGTPIENSVLDLWSIFDFLMPGYLPSLDNFKSNYESDPNYTKTIKKYTTPFILKRLKQDVLKDLPYKYEMVVTCEMSNEQRKTYDAIKLQAKETIESDKNGAFNVLPLLMRMRQACITPSLFIENYYGESGKLKSLYNIINEEIDSGNRILIFSQFVESLKIIEKELTSQFIPYFKITGQTKSEERLRICNEFNANTRYKIVLISLKAGGTGLNLIGANVVIHLDPWWNYAVEAQATDRTHRIGQTKNVKVIKLICENSIEQRVIELQEMKKDIVKNVISTNDQGITNLTKEDINFILNN